MFPPPPATLDIEALPDIFGSISVACWIFVFTPQIYKNWKRSSTDGLATNFLVIWTAGDVCNVIGAICQGVLPTMIILALYYILADIALLYQVYIYGGQSPDNAPRDVGSAPSDNERQPLLAISSPSPAYDETQPKPSLVGRVRQYFQNAEHSSPATPLIDERYDNAARRPAQPRTILQEVWFNTYMVLLVVAAGLSGWYISTAVARHRSRHHDYNKHDSLEPAEPMEFDLVGQTFGYLCAALYLGSRIPQILTNYRRKSTEALSLLFILYACLGNITYDMSIFTYSPEVNCHAGPGRCEKGEAGAIYRRYLAINASWLVGSLGALFLDLIVFAQFFMYGDEESDCGSAN